MAYLVIFKNKGRIYDIFKNKSLIFVIFLRTKWLRSYKIKNTWASNKITGSYKNKVCIYLESCKFRPYFARIFAEKVLVFRLYFYKIEPVWRILYTA